MTGIGNSSIDIADDTYISADISAVAAVIRDQSRWQIWWPDRVLSVYSDRGEKGLRWTVSGDFVGSAEIWIEELSPGAIPGVVVHYYLRVDPTSEGSRLVRRVPTGSPRANRYLAKVRHRQVTSWKRIIWQVKDELEGRG